MLYEYDSFGNMTKQTLALAATPTKDNSPLVEIAYSVESSEEGADDIYTTTTFSGALSSSDLTWDPTELEYNTKYSIGSKGPGWWPQENLSANSVLLKSASATVTTYAIPEPTTATLSLLPLVGLAARRRRQASR